MNESQFVSPSNRSACPPSRRAATWAIFAALVAFLPIPFIVPFWAMAFVPVSYLVISAERVGIVGVCYGLVATPVLFLITKLVCALIYRTLARSTPVRLVSALVLMLFVLSLLPIYKPGLDPVRPAVNIITLFRHGIPVGQ